LAPARGQLEKVRQELAKHTDNELRSFQLLSSL